MSSRPDVGVVIAAAGSGLRAGGVSAKQFQLIGGVPMLLWSLRRFLGNPAVAVVVVVLPPDVVAAPPSWIEELVGERCKLVAGGAERADSVAAGVASLGVGVSVVVVHDGARPFVSQATIDAVIATARTGTGAVAAVPVVDTLKQATAGRIEATLPRQSLWRAQTPQAFPINQLRAGLERARALGLSPTDDAAAVELAGGTVVIVPDETGNFKVTTPADLAVARAVAGAA